MFILLNALLFSLLPCTIYTSPAFSREQNTIVKVALLKELSTDHYVTHILMDIVAQCALMGVGGFGVLVGSGLSFFVDPDNPRINEGVMGLTALPAMLAAFYLYYKAPQWIDTHMLGYHTIRTRKKNVISFLSRIFLGFSFLGPLAGEYITRKISDVEVVEY